MKNPLPGKHAPEFSSFLKEIGGIIRKRREDLGLNQDALDLNPLPLDTRKYQRIEYGEENFTMQTLFAICKNLNIHPKEVFDLDFPLKPQK